MFKKASLLVESVENPYGDYYSVKLKIDDNLTWEAGEHGVFKLPGKAVNGKKWRAFSVASVTSEGYMLVGTRTGDQASSFKQELINMKAGERVSVRGPFGWFKEQDKTSSLVMMAAGVGITPIRALLMSLKDEKKRDIHVVYVSSDYHLYGEDLDEIVEKNDSIKLYKLSDRKEASDKLRAIAKENGNNAFYYISGSMKVIKSTKNLLKNENIQSKRVISDFFLGY